MTLKHILKKSLKADMMNYMETHPQEFESLVQFAIADEQPYSWRAAWLLSKCMKDNDKRIKPYLDKMIHFFPSAIDSQKRDLINVICKMEINEAQEGILLDACIATWCKLDKISSVRFNSMKLILQIAKKYPELYEEIALLTHDDYTNSLSAGIKKSLEKMVQTFEKGL